MAMGRDPRHDVLFEPLDIGPKTLRNRFYQVPHDPGFAPGSPEQEARYRELKAEGGWAAVCAGQTAVSGDGTTIATGLLDGVDAANWTLMTEAVHRHGSLAGIELAHPGVYSPNVASRLPSI